MYSLQSVRLRARLYALHKCIFCEVFLYAVVCFPVFICENLKPKPETQV